MDNKDNNKFCVSSDYYEVKNTNTIGYIVKEDDNYIYLELYDKKIIKIDKKTVILK